MEPLPHGLNEAPNLTVQEVADTIGLSYHAVLRAVHRGEVRAYKVCGRVRLRRRDVLIWIGACALDIEPEPPPTEPPPPEPGTLEHLRDLERRRRDQRDDRD